MKTILLLGAACIVTSLTSAPAFAKGCGGYVNVAVWGCAPWDNNPPKAGVTPGYKAPAPKPIAQPRQPTPPSTNLNSGGRLVTDNGAGLIARDGGGFKPNANQLIGNDGSTLKNNKLVGNDGASLGAKPNPNLISNSNSGLLSPGNRTGSSFR